jgi:hypothetical protein
MHFNFAYLTDLWFSILYLNYLYSIYMDTFKTHTYSPQTVCL